MKKNIFSTPIKSNVCHEKTDLNISDLDSKGFWTQKVRLSFLPKSEKKSGKKLCPKEIISKNAKNLGLSEKY
jgi:hypothetical protein